MITENVSTLKIHKLTQEQLDRTIANGEVDNQAIYLTPDEGISLDENVLEEYLNGKADKVHTHTMDDVENLQTSLDQMTETLSQMQDDIDSKMSNDNPVGTGTFSMGRLTDSEIGKNSFAMGEDVIASGDYSHSEGYGTIASAITSHAEGSGCRALARSSHAEGNNTEANNYFAHAEGDSTVASGDGSHAEGWNTEARGGASHAEGDGTIASGECQHVQGQYNIADSEDRYAHIVGNGFADNQRSNAHTLDWDGNAWFKGSVYVGGTSQDDASELSTKAYAESVANTVKNDLLNGAGAAYDTLKELGDLIDSNADGIDALETIASGKADRVHIHAISDVTDLQTTLDVKTNQNAFSNIAVSGQNTIQADSVTDTLTLAAGNNITITTDTTNDKVTISATDTVYTHPTSAGNKHIPSGGSSGNFLKYSSSGTATWSDLPSANTSQSGIVQLTNSTSSTSTSTAATPNSVKSAYDLANTANNAVTNLQTTVDGKQATITGAATTITSSNLTASRALVSNSSGKVAVSDITSTELGYLDGVTSNIQAQLDGKASSSHTHSEYISENRQEGSAIGQNSIAKGWAIASGGFSASMGYDTKATGDYSQATGMWTTASGDYSHAEGYETTASNNASHSEGYETTASGSYAHSEGYYTTASGDASHSEGYNTTALLNQHAQGHYNNTTNAKEGVSSGTGTGTAFVIGNGTSSAASNAFRVNYDGKPYSKSALTTTGCDYAEFFEWQDLNPNDEDRRGYFVTLDGDKIKIAEPNDYILGIISGQPSVIGNGDEDWLGRYVFDEFGAFVYEEFEYEVEVPEKIQEEIVNEETGEITTKTKIVMKTITKTGTRYKENPDYDPSREYNQREDRPEWDAVGMLGVLSVRDDGSCQINGYCKVAEGGIATASETGYRVIKRVSDNIVKVIFR